MSSDPTSSSKPPTSLPFPSRAAPPRAGQGFGLLSAKSPGATPIPPSLQAKMAAMANRGAAAAAAAAAAGGGPGGVGTPGVAMPAAGRAPVPGGMAARRAKPGFKLSDIEGAGPASAGPMVGGLGQGRPNFQDENQRRPSGLMATPFSTLSKIVCVLSPSFFRFRVDIYGTLSTHFIVFSSHRPPSILTVIHPAHSALVERRS
jgi:mitogen-activated protein kinase kinase